jgi:hypothetical protein
VLGQKTELTVKSRRRSAINRRRRGRERRRKRGMRRRRMRMRRRGGGEVREEDKRVLFQPRRIPLRLTVRN